MRVCETRQNKAYPKKDGEEVVNEISMIGEALKEQSMKIPKTGT